MHIVHTCRLTHDTTAGSSPLARPCIHTALDRTIQGATHAGALGSPLIAAMPLLWVVAGVPVARVGNAGLLGADEQSFRAVQIILGLTVMVSDGSKNSVLNCSNDGADLLGADEAACELLAAAIEHLRRRLALEPYGGRGPTHGQGVAGAAASIRPWRARSLFVSLRRGRELPANDEPAAHRL